MTQSQPLHIDQDPLFQWMDTTSGPHVVCVFAPSDPSKRSLIQLLVARAETLGYTNFILGADLGQNPWASPACVSLSNATEDLLHLTFVGSLDPLRMQGRYIGALHDASLRCPKDSQTIVWVDAPGLVRGRASADLLRIFVQTLQTTAIVAVWDPPRLETLRASFATLPDLFSLSLPTPHSWTRPTRSVRRTQRTETFKHFVDISSLYTIPAHTVGVFGTHWAGEDWIGAVVGLLGARGETCGVGVVESVEIPHSTPEAHDVRNPLKSILHVRAHAIHRHTPLNIHGVITGNVLYTTDQGLFTRAERRTLTPRISPSWTTVERPRIPVPISWPTARGDALYQPRMLNSLFGDPGMVIRHRTSGRALAFDLGWLEEPLPGKILHGITDIFISHGHMDHFQGMVAVLRSLMGPGGSLRLYGPPHLRTLVSSLLSAFRFNLFNDDTSPVLIVHTLEGDQVRRARIRCTDSPTFEELGSTFSPDGLLLDEGELQVHAIQLQHSVPVLAFRATLPARASGESPYPPEKESFSLTYVTDIGPSKENLKKAEKFAQNTDILVCESTFRPSELKRAQQTHHLTTHVCAQLALDCGAKRLVPFHVSPRYQDAPRDVYRELLSIFPHIVPAERMTLPYPESE